MHERRVFIELPERSDPIGQSVELSKSDSHHLLRVIRLTSGSSLTLVDSPSGRIFEGTLVGTNDPAVVKIIQENTRTEERVYPASLLFALCKGKKNDFIAEKAAELGIARVIFWQAERSIVRLDEEEEREKREARLRKIAEEASKQAARSSKLEVFVAESAERALECLEPFTGAGDRRIICSLREDSKRLSEIMPIQSNVHIVIGPEGDLSPNEEDLFRKTGFFPITLGSVRLKSETAALAAIASLQACGLLSG